MKHLRFKSVAATPPLPLTSALPACVFLYPGSENLYTCSAFPCSHFIFSLIIFAKYLNHLYSLKTKSFLPPGVALLLLLLSRFSRFRLCETP